MSAVDKLVAALRNMRDLAAEAIEARRSSSDEQDHELLPVYEQQLAEADAMLAVESRSIFPQRTMPDPPMPPVKAPGSAIDASQVRRDGDFLVSDLVVANQGMIDKISSGNVERPRVYSEREIVKHGADMYLLGRGAAGAALATQPAAGVPEGFNEGVQAVANMIQQKADDYFEQYGSVEHDTDAVTFGSGEHAQIKFDHWAGLSELAEEIRSMRKAATPPAPDEGEVDQSEDFNKWAEQQGYPTLMRDGKFVAHTTRAAFNAWASTKGRFFMDHGAWHDRVTGQHMWTQDQYDQHGRDRYQQGLNDQASGAVLPGFNAAPDAQAPVVGDVADQLSQKILSLLSARGLLQGVPNNNVHILGSELLDHIRSVLSVQTPAYGIIDPDYARYYSIIRCTAWQYGYAIAMHGSFTRDLDLVMVPWTDEAREPEHVLKVIIGRTDLRMSGNPPTNKPHGRTTHTLLLPAFGDPRWIDLSIMPKQAAPAGDDARDAVLEEAAKLCEQEEQDWEGDHPRCAARGCAERIRAQKSDAAMREKGGAA